MAELESKRSDPEGREETSFLDLLVLLAQHKMLVVKSCAVAGVVSVIVALLLPKWYLATAKILPPQQSQSNAVAILGQLGALTGGATQALGIKNPSDIYVAMLRSRTIADRLIDRFNLKEVYDETLPYHLRRELAKNSSISASREGVITIEVEDKDPKRSADIANAYVEELKTFTLTLAVSEAAQRRLFFESQLKKAKSDLVLAEIELKKFSQDTGLVSLQGQIGLTVAAAAALRAQITAKEIQLSAMRSFATEQNPDIQRTYKEIVGLRGELAKMEKDAHSAKGDVLVPVGRAPEAGLEYIRRYRDVKYYETLFEVLAKQYEIARIDEAKDATLIQVLDQAVVPDRRNRPKRTLIVVLATLMAGLAAFTWVLVRERWKQASQDPARAERLSALRRYASFR